MTLLCGLLGLPPVNGVLPQSPMHTKALAQVAGKRQMRSQKQQQGCLRSKNGQWRNEWASLGGTWVLQASNRHRQQWNLVSAQRREGSGRGAYPCCHACQPRKLG
jgi:hypothetical protein